MAGNEAIVQVERSGAMADAAVKVVGALFEDVALERIDDKTGRRTIHGS